MRHDNRDNKEHRPIKITRQFTKHALGSVLVEYGDTKVLCTATVEDRVPPFLRDMGRGWLTAEYSMLPSATHTRSRREVSKGKPSGRTSEIQRLIGRSLRAILDFDLLGERTIYIDADVIQADGGTRTASITGGMVALNDALSQMVLDRKITENPIKEWIASISVGKYQGEIITDLDYIEDSNADLDMNLVMTESGKFVEIQGTAEVSPISKEELDQLVEHGRDAISSIIQLVKPTPVL
jgi:ribonuclease PH